MYKDLGLLEAFHVHLVSGTTFEHFDLFVVNADTLCEHCTFLVILVPSVHTETSCCLHLDIRQF